MYPILQGENGQNEPENQQNWKMAKIAPKSDKYLGNFLTIKVVLETRFGHSKCHFLWSENGHFCQKCQSLRPQKWHFEWPNQNSKTTFIVQTFPKYGPYDFYLVNLSLLGAILAIFQFCGFSGLFWPFSPCNCNV